MEQSPQSFVILSYTTHRFHTIFSRTAFWIGIASLAIVVLCALLSLIMKIFDKVAMYVVIDALLGGFLIVMSFLYKKVIEKLSNRGQLVMENDRIKVIHKSGSSEEVKELIAYTNKFRPLMMLRAITSSGNKVNFRMSLIPDNRLHINIGQLEELAQNSGVGYSMKRYTLVSRWT